MRKEDALGRVITMSYDANRNLTAEINGAGESKIHTYDANGFRTSTRNALNQTANITFSAVGTPLTLTNAIGFTQTIIYDGNFKPQRITDPLGVVAEFTYNAQGLPVTMKDGRGNTFTYGYNANGDRISTAEPLPRTSTAVFNTRGEKTSETNARGFVTNFDYDALSRMTKMTEPLGKITQYEYDANGNKTAEMDALGRRTEFTYDASDRLTKTRFADNTFTESTYDFRGKKLTQKDEFGRITKYEYDLAGQLKKVTRAFGTADASSTEATYDLAGRKLTDKDARGNVTTYGYDQAGRMVSMTNANNKTWTYAYDNRDRRTSMTDPRNRTTLYEYDGRGRQTKVTSPDATFVLQTYEGMGLMLSRTDQANKTSFWSYDTASRLKTMTDALGNITEYGLDNANNKISQKDARLNTTTYEWDALNRRAKRCLPAGMCELMTYDLVGNMLTRTDFNGRAITYSHDLRNRQLTVAASAVAFPGELGITTTYSPTGKRLSMVDASGTTTWAYDNQDRVSAKATPQGTLSYTYLPNSLVASVNSSNANGTSINYGYDNVNRLATVLDNRLAATTTNSFDDADNLATIVYPNGVINSYTVDQKDQVTVLQIQRNAAILANYGYGRAATGAINSVAESTGRAVNYTYDNAWRLTNETMTGDPVPANNGNLSYLLDAVANRTSLTSTLFALNNQSFTFDANDRITADTGDANGNTLTSNGKTYTYDFLDRLNTATGGITLVYDGEGNRIVRNSTRYLIDDQTPLGYTQVAEEVISGIVSRRYVYGLKRISQTQGGNSNYYLYDGDGTVRALADSGGSVTDTFAFDAFGNLTARTGTTPNEKLYRGEQFDTGLGLYYLRARWYDPLKGRFLVRDPYEGDAQDPRTLVPYSYAFANPVLFSDPGGRSVMERAIPLGLITLAAATALTPIAEFPLPDGSSPRFNAASWSALCIFRGAGSLMGLGIRLTGGTANPYFMSGICTFSASSKDDAPPVAIPVPIADVKGPGDPEGCNKLPTGSRGINETPYTGDHGPIKEQINARPMDNVFIDPNGGVWLELPNGTYQPHGPVEQYLPGNRRGNDWREERRRRNRKGCPL